MQYVSPADYDREHRRKGPPESTKEGKLLKHALEEYSPSSVLEFGPGSGFYTKQIFSFPSVEEYHAIDIVQPCLDHVRAEVASKQDNIRASFICGDFLKHEFRQKYDLILFMSTLHHIPNRFEYLEKCSRLLSDRGVVVVIEPMHNIVRILQLIWRFCKKYHKKSFWHNRENLSTHHFITMLEMKHLTKKCNIKMNEIIFFSFTGEKFAPLAIRSKLGFLTCSRRNPISIFANQVYVSFSKNLE
jgi:2-polyprenyl-3-methyl-5-hydroxy-6-metoxy-1,4-benzoquinol methylase